MVEHCSAEGLYVILDLHAVPGGQNQDWHSDSGMSEAMFWRFKEFQDRVINLWVEIAKRYKGNPYVNLPICWKVDNSWRADNTSILGGRI